MRLPHNQRPAAFTFWELLGVIAAISVLITLAWSHVTRPRRTGHPPTCISNLKQIVLSFKFYSDDHDMEFPGAQKAVLPSKNAEANPSSALWEYLLPVSNYFGNAQILVCPQDAARFTNYASGFTPNSDGLAHPSKQNASISYFLGVSANDAKPNILAAGDRNWASSPRASLFSSVKEGIINVPTNATWRTYPTQPFHGAANYFALSDGSVQLADTDRLREALKLARDSYGTNANRFLFPQ